MHISITTIYEWIQANKSQRGTVILQLRQSRKKRRNRYGTGHSRHTILGRKPIEEHPRSAKNRSRLGHWESDTIEGKKGTGFLVTHVERKTGYLVMEHLEDKQSATLNAGSVKAFQNIPGPLNDITNCQ